VRTLVETGVLIGPPGAYHLGTSLDRLAVQVEHLAHHALRGEVWDKAMGYCRQAGEKALAHSAHREAVGSFEQALSALAHLPETRATREQAIDFGRTLASFEGA
jgi:hypothetical protein